MGRYNFKNYERKNNRYKNDDLNIDRLSKELIHPRERNNAYDYHKPSRRPDRIGVNLQLMNGQSYKTSEFTVEDIAEALEQGRFWLKRKNGGAINLRFLLGYSPYKFYPRDDYRPGKQR